MKFSTDEQGIDAVSQKKWNLQIPREHAQLLEELGSRGPQLLWTQAQDRRRHDSVVMHVSMCRRQDASQKYYILEADWL
jgi:hypothetical protein